MSKKQQQQQQSRRVGIFLPKSVYENAKVAAQREHRSFSNYIVMLLDRATEGETPLERRKEKAA